MKIYRMSSLCNFLNCYSGFAGDTINSVIIAMGYNPLRSTQEDFIEVARTLKECAEHGADSGFSGFIYYSDTVPFFIKHRRDIVAHMEKAAAELGTDIISMVQGFGVFRHGDKPTTSEVGRALWENTKDKNLTSLYNVFSWYALEEISHTWLRYLEENWDFAAELSA